MVAEWIDAQTYRCWIFVFHAACVQTSPLHYFVFPISVLFLSFCFLFCFIFFLSRFAFFLPPFRHLLPLKRDFTNCRVCRPMIVFFSGQWKIMNCEGQYISIKEVLVLFLIV